MNCLTSIEKPFQRAKAEINGGVMSLYQFTKRELDILRYAIYGYSAKRIGLNLNISYRTVEKHLESIKSKLNCKRSSEIAMVCMKNSYLKEILFDQEL